MKLLSTKILDDHNFGKISKEKITLSQYNAIDVKEVDFNSPGHIKNAIFTSKHAVNAVLKKKVTINNCYCVGEKTKSILLKMNQKVVKNSKNAQELANFIVKKAKNDDFLFFCGNRKREELPNILFDNKVNLSIIETYNTNLNFKKINTDFEAIMFFSPSAIESYTKLNKIKNETIFTIGETTSKAAQKYSNNIITAKSQSIEEVVKNVIKYSIND